MRVEKLIEEAKRARDRAYAPYSSFRVGAALLDSEDRVFFGCNVENISFGLTMCAERVAIGAGVAAGSTAFKMIAVVSDSAQPVVPCGACRQVLAEFAPDLRVLSATLAGQTMEWSMARLLPSPTQGILR